MEEMMFESANKTVKTTSGLMAFKDCPNHCIDGWLFNPYTGSKTMCEFCEDKRKKMVLDRGTDKASNKSIAELLNLQESLLGIQYDFTTILPDQYIKDLTSESVVKMKTFLQTLMDKAVVGEIPDYSIMLNLGSKSFDMNFIYPYMMRCYLAGCSIAPLVTPIDICKLRGFAEKFGIQDDEKGLNYYTLVDKSVCVISIDAGTKYDGVNAVKGLMQLRAAKGNSTLITTNAWGKDILNLCTDSELKCKNLAYLVSVDYTEKAADLERKRKEQLGNVVTTKGQEMTNSAMLGMFKETKQVGVN